MKPVVQGCAPHALCPNDSFDAAMSKACERAATLAVNRASRVDVSRDRRSATEDIGMAVHPPRGGNTVK